MCPVGQLNSQWFQLCMSHSFYPCTQTHSFFCRRIGWRMWFLPGLWYHLVFGVWLGCTWLYHSTVEFSDSDWSEDINTFSVTAARALVPITRFTWMCLSISVTYKGARMPNTTHALHKSMAWWRFLWDGICFVLLKGVFSSQGYTMVLAGLLVKWQDVFFVLFNSLVKFKERGKKSKSGKKRSL